VKAADPTLEVAVLQIEAEDLTPITFGDARTLKKGQIAISLGNPLGIARDGQASAAWGMIANLGRTAPPNPRSRARSGRESLHHYGTLIHVDARQPQGSSGGALINLRGEMVGMLTTYTSLPQQDREAGYAIGIDDDFRKALDTLKMGRLPEYGFLGIAPRALAAAERQGGRTGTAVEDVVAGTPAAKAGVKVGDIITHVDDELVLDDMHLIRLVSGMPAESKVTLQVVRGKPPARPVSIPVVLSKKYTESSRESYAQTRDPPWRGMQVEYATASPAFRELARHIDPEGCVAVLEVERDTPAWKAGLRGGLFVSHVNQQRVTTPKEFQSAVEDAPGEVALRITTAEGGPVRVVPAP
jgi:S1-C subfamily serine protease